MVIEVVRGLGLGGAEALLITRLRYEDRIGARRTRLVTNTHSCESFYAKPLSQCGIDVVDLRTSSRWKSAWRLWRVAQAFPPNEVVVVHSPWPAAVLKVRRALKLTSAPLVEVAHSTRYARATLLLGRLLNRFASLCIAVSEDVANSSTAQGYPQVVVVEAGVDQGMMREWVLANPDAPARYRERLGIRPSARLVVSVGNLFPLKRHKVLVDQAAQLASDVHVVIVGGGREREALLSAAVDSGVADRVHLIGSEGDAWRWIAVADAVAHPSAREGLPVVLMEARALGVPALASIVHGGVRDACGR